MTGDRVFGSDELTPELVRGATFSEEGGRYDAAEVRAFLDRVASSVEVFQSEDAPTALRAEFRRNAEIAQQVLDAGQNASEQLRRQASEAAEAVLEQARAEAEGLRATLESEISHSLSHVDQLRNQFIQDLRDLYDRIGASLYRFEQAAKDAPALSVAAPEPAPSPEHVAPAQPAA
ncbi:MAG: hypothetical protein JWM86_2886, partial [Thermoleophilia bacterium]|nr:hypothetical protein [Thermoleophilia bacterium]